MTEEQKEEILMNLKKPYYSIYEAADVLRVHERTIRNHIKSGDLKAGKIGRQWRISREALLQAVEDIN